MQHLPIQLQFADQRVVDAFATAVQGAHPVPGPPVAEVGVLDGQLTDQVGESRVAGRPGGGHAEAVGGLGGDPRPVGEQVAHARVEKDQADETALLRWDFAEIEEQRGGRGIPSEYVGAGIQDEGRSVRHGVDEVTQRCRDLGLGAVSAPLGPRLCQHAQVFVFGVAQAQRTGDTRQQVLRGHRHPALFEAGVVVHTHRRQLRDLFAPQPLDPARIPDGRQPDLFGRDSRPLGLQKFAEFTHQPSVAPVPPAFLVVSSPGTASPATTPPWLPGRAARSLDSATEITTPEREFTMTTLTLDAATRLAAAGQRAAAAIGVPMIIAIVDAAGHLLHFSRQDDALLGSIDLAIRKAKTCVLFRMPTAALGELSRPDGPIYGIEWTNGGLVSFVGGLPLTDADGRVIGAVGVSGGRGTQDLEVAQACAEALTPSMTH